MKNLEDLKEQLQEDIITRFDETLCGKDLDCLCQIVVDRINELKQNTGQ